MRQDDSPEWADRYLRGVKRDLSRYEKETAVPSSGAKAMIMPSCPNTEVEELIAVGYRPEQIFCVEREQTLADALLEHYWDSVHVHWDEVGHFLERAVGPFSYLHLDYCGHLLHDELAGIEAAHMKLAAYARLRVSLLRVRQRDTTRDYEHLLAENILVRLAAVCQSRDRYESRWDTYLDALIDGDTTQIVLGIWLLNHLFGLGVWEYADRCTVQGDYLPEVNGTHILTNIRRFTYNEVGGRSPMYTVWCDAAPLRTDVSNDPQWVVDEVARVFHAMAQPILSFSNPDLYLEVDT